MFTIICSISRLFESIHLPGREGSPSEKCLLVSHKLYMQIINFYKMLLYKEAIDVRMARLTTPFYIQIPTACSTMFCEISPRSSEIEETAVN